MLRIRQHFTTRDGMGQSNHGTLNNTTGTVMTKRTVQRAAFAMTSVLLAALFALSSNNVADTTNAGFRGLLQRRSLFTPYDMTPSTQLPAWTNNLVDVWDANPPATATPLFWYIPKAGGSTLNKIMTYCLNLTLASDKGNALNQTVRTRILCRYCSCHGVVKPRWLSVSLLVSLSLCCRVLSFVLAFPLSLSLMHTLTLTHVYMHTLTHRLPKTTTITGPTRWIRTWQLRLQIPQPHSSVRECPDRYH